MAAVNAAFTAATGIAVKMNTVDHSTFQDQITNYLGGTPDTAYTWFSGFRMKFFADKGLTAPIDDVWAKVKGNFTEGFGQSVDRQRRQGLRDPGRLLPVGRLLPQERLQPTRATRPEDVGRLHDPGHKMQADGLTPIAFADKDGWPAMGTFDILNLRLNGYDFHVDLMAGKEKWTDPKVTAVFQKWEEILPFHAKDYAGLTWHRRGQHARPEEVRDVLARPVRVRRSSARPRTRPTSPTSTSSRSRPSARSTTPRRRSTPRSTRGSSPPSRRTSRPRRDAAKAYLEFWSKGSTQGIFFQHQPGVLPTATDSDTSKYTALQKKAVEIVGAAKRITQFLDRDTRPDFADPDGMQGFLQTFLANPTQDLAAYQKTHPGLLGPAAPAPHQPDYPDPVSGSTTDIPTIRPARSPHRRGGCALSAPRRRYSLLTRRDKVVMGLMVGIPTFLCLVLIWLPTLFSVVLSFTNWQGITALDGQELRRPQELRDAVHGVPAVLAGRLAQHPLAAGVRVHRDADRHLPRGAARPGDARDADLPERVLHPGRPVAGHRRVHLAAPVHVAGLHQQRPRADEPGQRHRLAGQPATSTSGPSWSRPAGATSAT